MFFYICGTPWFQMGNTLKIATFRLVFCVIVSQLDFDEGIGLKNSSQGSQFLCIIANAMVQF